MKTSLAKIAQLLPNQFSFNLAALSENVRFQNQSTLAVDHKTLNIAAFASIGQDTIEFDYMGAFTSERARRRVDVHLLYNLEGNWYAISYDHMQKAFRDFHLGLVSNIRATGEYFERQTDWNAEEYLVRGYSKIRGEK